MNTNTNTPAQDLAARILAWLGPNGRENSASLLLYEAMQELKRVGTPAVAAPAAPQAVPDTPYSLDADPAGIRALAADAITGALAFGAQGNNPAPAGHWLAPFWQMGRDATQPTTQPADAQDAARLDWLLPIVGGDDSATADARTLALGAQIMAGRTGRDAIDAARTQEGATHG